MSGMRHNDKYYEIYEFIVAYVTKNLNAPTIREICNSVGIKSTGTIYIYLQRMERAGLIRLENRKIVLIGYKVEPISHNEEE